MAQFNWLYLGDNGRRYNVGLFHGDRTGHLMVMCNARIVLIDFNVKQAKDYSFFIDDELFELSVEGNPGNYQYNCAINEDADTPRNRVRKRQKRLDFRKSVAAISLFVLVLLGVLGFAMVNQQATPQPVSKAVLLRQEGLETIARISIRSDAAADRGPVISYSFVADGQVKQYERSLDRDLFNGFPLADGDEFRLRYLLNRPREHQLDFDRPTPRQLERYLERTIQHHIDLNPQLTRRQARCRVEVAYRLNGVEGLATLFHQNVAPDRQRAYNALTYKKFVRDIPCQEAVEKECW